MLLDRTNLPDSGTTIDFYEIDRPLEVVGLVYRQVDRSRRFMELPLVVFEELVGLTGTAPFYEIGDYQFVVSPRLPAEPEPADDDDGELFGPDGELRAIPMPPPPDKPLADLAAGLARWHEALQATDPADIAQRLGTLYPAPVPSGAQIQADAIETVAWLAERVRQANDRGGAIAISGI